MAIVSQMLAYFVYYLLGALQMAMMVRAILSWIMPDGDGALLRFLYAITEPIIGFVRTVLHRLGVNVEGPLDLSFLVTVLLFSALQVVFQALIV